MPKTDAEIRVLVSEEAQRILDAHIVLLEQMNRIQAACATLSENGATIDFITVHAAPRVRVRFPGWGGYYIERDTLVEAAEATAKRQSDIQSDAPMADVPMTGADRAMLQRLTRFGSSLEVSWGEDDNLWSVAWITRGVRFASADRRLRTALETVWFDAAVHWAKAE